MASGSFFFYKTIEIKLPTYTTNGSTNFDVRSMYRPSCTVYYPQQQLHLFVWLIKDPQMLLNTDMGSLKQKLFANAKFKKH